MKYTSTLIAVNDMEKSKQFYLYIENIKRYWHNNTVGIVEIED